MLYKTKLYKYNRNVLYQFGFGFSLFLMNTNLPKYMNDVLKFSILKNGIFSALPHIACWSFALCSAFAADSLINNSIMTITNVRKIFGSLSKINDSKLSEYLY